MTPSGLRPVVEHWTAVPCQRGRVFPEIHMGRRILEALSGGRVGDLGRLAVEQLGRLATLQQHRAQGIARW